MAAPGLGTLCKVDLDRFHLFNFRLFLERFPGEFTGKCPHTKQARPDLHDQVSITGQMVIGYPAFSSVHPCAAGSSEDRKSTRLNSSHVSISYAVFCLKKNTRSCVSILLQAK